MRENLCKKKECIILGNRKLDQQQLTELLNAAFPGAEIKAMDLTGGGDHWSVRIAAREFKGLSLVEQHQLVYKALGDLMKKEIHALALDTSVLP